MKFLHLGKGLAVSVLVLAVAGLSVFSVVLYNKYQQVSQKTTVQGAATSPEQEIKSLIEAISKVADIPQNESPTVATVSDVSKLSGQTFFKDAKNGDKVLVYEASKKAYLYRPSTGKLINIGPVADTTTVETKTASGSAATISPEEKMVKVVLLNGTTKIGLTKTAGDLLLSKKLNLEIIDRDNAKLSDYADTIITDISGKNKIIASEIASLLGGQISELPEDEIAPKDADILIILGTSYSE